MQQECRGSRHGIFLCFAHYICEAKYAHFHLRVHYFITMFTIRPGT